jgi:3-dehydroquinate dehydratase, type II
MKLLVINGPNINMLGIREPDIYGKRDYNALCEYIKQVCDSENIEVELFQSNHEGVIIDCIQKAHNKMNAIVINPAAYTHTSIAIMDAIKAVGIPTVEVHLTDISEREEFRHISYTALACCKSFSGNGFESYKNAILYVKQLIVE